MQNRKKKKLIELLQEMNAVCVQALTDLKEQPEEFQYSCFIDLQENLDHIFDHLFTNQESNGQKRLIEPTEEALTASLPSHVIDDKDFQSPVNLIIIDDENTILLMLEEFFKGKNVNLILLDSGKNILQILEQHPEIDVIMTDIRMPEVSGIDILKLVKTGSHSDIEVILMSAYRDVNVLMAGIEQGAFSFIFKPFNLNYLVNQIYKASTFKHLQQNESMIRVISKNKNAPQGGDDLASNSQMVNFLNSMSSLMILADRDLKIISSNFRYLGHIPIKRDHIGSMCDIFQCSSCNDCVFRRAILSLENHLHHHLQAVLKSKLYPSMMYLTIGVTLFDPVEGLYLFTIEDITNQKTQELKLFYKERLIALGRIALGISHEVNQPLNCISTIIQNHLMKLNRKEIISRDSLISDDSLMLDEIKKISRIIENFKIFGRPYKHVNYENICLQEVLLKVFHLLNPLLQENGIELERDIPEKEIIFYGNEFQMQEIFMNLINNASDSIEEKQKKSPESSRGVIKVTLLEVDDWVTVRISDNGIGISHDDLSCIFDPFFTTKDVGRGMGLGLSITYGIVKSFLGDIWATSELGVGSDFEINLPKTGTRRKDY